MDMDAQEVKPASPPRRHRYRLLAGLFLLLMMAGMVFLVMAVSRPHYRTYVSPPLFNTHLAFSVEVPDDWQPPSEGSFFRKSRDFPGLEFQPSLPTGMACWWQEHILRQDMQRWEQDYMMIIVEDSSTMQTIAQEEDYFRTFSPSSIWRRFRHRLGPALDITFIQHPVPLHHIGTVSGASGNRLPSEDMLIHWIFIYPPEMPTHRIFITAGGSPKHASHLKSSLSHIAESVRLVDSSRL